MKPSIPPAWIDPAATEAVARVLAELGSHPESCPLATDLADRLGCDVEDVWEALGEAERGGWAETWADDPRGPSVALSALSASRLGLRLSSDGRRWLGPGQVERTFGEAPPYVTMTDLTDPATWDGPDPLASLEDSRAMQGIDSLALSEACEKMAADYVAGLDPASRPRPDGLANLVKAWQGFGSSLDRAKLPQPVLIFGLSPAWPVRRPASGPCPGCRSRRLGPAAYCLICNRSGIDHLLGSADQLPPGPGAAEVKAALAEAGRKGKAGGGKAARR